MRVTSGSLTSNHIIRKYLILNCKCSKSDFFLLTALCFDGITAGAITESALRLTAFWHEFPHFSPEARASNW